MDPFQRKLLSQLLSDDVGEAGADAFTGFKQRDGVLWSQLYSTFRLLLYALGHEPKEEVVELLNLLDI